MNKTLHVFQVSPLFRFSFQKAALNRLSRKIGLYVQKVFEYIINSLIYTIEKDSLIVIFKYIGEDTYGHGPGLTSDVEVDITRIKGFHSK